MSRGQIISTNIRFDLGNDADKRAWDYLQRRDKQEHRSYSKAVVAAVNDYFDRRERTDADPYLETREKEDAFLQRVLETIRDGLGHSVPVSASDVLVQLLQSVQQQAVPEKETQGEQQEADDMALDFVDGF